MTKKQTIPSVSVNYVSNSSSTKMTVKPPYPKEKIGADELKKKEKH